ncbi:hypothetical protein RHGRI_035992 [Rhododendron griersonianum]|uniref:Uncharacterized protein n=1 Tax=Rhododendron griersonianum TaxID=479676 RepID=A0AAV6HM50_9ERIC|nr:hypothetical protein RHGRI_035992 [Rhododendron griersonianum]
MAGVPKTVLVVLAIFLVAFLSGAEGGRDFSTRGGEVYNPQAFWFPHIPWWWASINKAESGPKDIAKGDARNIEVPQVDGTAGHGYLPEVDGMVSTEGEEVYNPQAFWFPQFHWWWPGSSKTEIRPEDKGKGETTNMEVPKIGGKSILVESGLINTKCPSTQWLYFKKYWQLEGGRDFSTKGGEVYNPQAFWFPHIPWWWASINKAESGPKDIAKGDTRNIEVPQVDGTAGHGYLPEVDGMVSTEGEEVYNPQAFWFPHFHWWWPGSSKTEIRPEDKGKGETTNMEVPKIGGMAGHGYLPKIDGMAGHGYP